MIEVKKDWHLLVKATECCRDFVPINDLISWMLRPQNLMLVEGNNVGLAAYKSPGVYYVHWYFHSARGREAIKLAQAMCAKMFNELGAETLIGMIKMRLKASRWACRKVGFKSYGQYNGDDNEDNEILFATKEEFLKGLNNG